MPAAAAKTWMAKLPVSPKLQIGPNGQLENAAATYARQIRPIDADNFSDIGIEAHVLPCIAGSNR